MKHALNEADFVPARTRQQIDSKWTDELREPCRAILRDSTLRTLFGILPKSELTVENADRGTRTERLLQLFGSAVRIAANNSVSLKGLSRNPTAPSSKALARTASSLRAVMKMIGIF